MDTDVNAAINILQGAGTARLPATHGQCGGDVPRRETGVGTNIVCEAT